jgi:hypothetical protein
LGRLVTMLRSAGVLVDDGSVQPATKRDLLVAGYVDFLREERGLSSLSVEAYRSDVRRFLQHSNRDDVRGLTSAEVSRAVLRETFDHSPASCGASASRCARSFGTAMSPGSPIPTCRHRRCRSRVGAAHCCLAG